MPGYVYWTLPEGRTDTSDSGAVLEKVTEYMQYWYQNKDKEDVPDMDIPVDLCLEVLMAADFLGMDRKSATRLTGRLSTNVSVTE